MKKPEPAKPEPPKQEAKKPEPAKQDPKKPEAEKKPDSSQDFASVLKNLQKQPKQEPSAAPASSSQPQRQQQAASSSPASNSAPKLADKLTSSQEDAVRKTVEACWNVDPGLAGIQDITVEIRLEIGRDGQVMRAEVIDKARMARDRTFRTVAESAQRAVMNPRCKTLPLPPDGYEFWKDAVFVFSPRDMLRG